MFYLKICMLLVLFSTIDGEDNASKTEEASTGKGTASGGNKASNGEKTANRGKPSNGTEHSNGEEPSNGKITSDREKPSNETDHSNGEKSSNDKITSNGGNPTNRTEHPNGKEPSNGEITSDGEKTSNGTKNGEGPSNGEITSHGEKSSNETESGEEPSNGEETSDAEEPPEDAEQSDGEDHSSGETTSDGKEPPEDAELSDEDYGDKILDIEIALDGEEFPNEAEASDEEGASNGEKESILDEEYTTEETDSGEEPSGQKTSGENENENDGESSEDGGSLEAEDSPSDEDPQSTSDDLWDELLKECGINRYHSKAKARIIDGAKAELGQFPWIARLGSKLYRHQLGFYCAGSLISRYYVVSAAHCDSTYDIVRLGENDVEAEVDCDSSGDCALPHQDIAISRFIFQDYCRGRSDHDLMLIELETPAEFNDFVHPVCLPRTPIKHEDIVGEAMLIAGFGMVDSKGGRSPHLMYVSNEVIDSADCNIVRGKLLDSQLCLGTKGLKKGNGTCNGDSGGPVTKNMIVGGQLRTYLIGVVSFGLAECEIGPSVYTDVSYYSEWIVQQMTKF